MVVFLFVLSAGVDVDCPRSEIGKLFSLTGQIVNSQLCGPYGLSHNCLTVLF